MVRVLIELGVSPTCQPLPAPGCPNQGQQALHTACSSGQVEVVRVLVELGADKEARDHRNWRPIHWAVVRGRPEVVKVRELCEGRRLYAYDARGGALRTHVKHSPIAY